MKRAVATLVVSSLIALDAASAQEGDLPDPPDEAQPADEPLPPDRTEEEEDEQKRMERDLEEWQERRPERTPKRRRRRRERRDDYYDEGYERPRDPGYHEHDGLYLHFGPGVGYMESTSRQGGDDYRNRGVAVGLDVELGGAAVRDFVIFGKISFSQVDEVDRQVNGTSLENFGAYTMAMLAVGGGAAFYLRQINVKLWAAAMVAQLVSVAESPSVRDSSTDWGPMLQLGAAKEWWVGHNWGIGGFARLSVGQLPEQNDALEPWRVTSILLGFSSTFN